MNDKILRELIDELILLCQRVVALEKIVASLEEARKEKEES